VGSGYSSLADTLIKFNQLGQLPFTLDRLDDGNGIKMTMKNNSARYHKSCKLKYNNTIAERAEKRLQAHDIEKYSTDGGCMHTRSNHTINTIIKDVFFCGKVPGKGDFHQTATFQIDDRVHACAVLLEDTRRHRAISKAQHCRYGSFRSQVPYKVFGGLV